MADPTLTVPTDASREIYLKIPDRPVTMSGAVEPGPVTIDPAQISNPTAAGISREPVSTERPPPNDATPVNLGAPKGVLSGDASGQAGPAVGTKVPVPGTDQVLPGEKSIMDVVHEQYGYNGVQRLAEAMLSGSDPLKAAIVAPLKSVDRVLGLMTVIPAVVGNVAGKGQAGALRGSGLPAEVQAQLAEIQNLSVQITYQLLYGGGLGQPSTVALKNIATMSAKAGELSDRVLATVKDFLPETQLGKASREIVDLTQKNGGATYHLVTGDQAGKDVAAVSLYPELTKVVEGLPTPRDIRDFVKSPEVSKLLASDRRLSVGTWNEKTAGAAGTGVTTLDVVATLPEPIAVKVAGPQAGNQRAIFHLGRMEEIPTGGTGEPVPNMPPMATRLSAWTGEDLARSFRDMTAQPAGTFSSLLRNELGAVGGKPPTVDRAWDLAKQGAAGANWYRGAARELERHFGEDAPLVADLIAAASPGLRVEKDLEVALQAYGRYKSGETVSQILTDLPVPSKTAPTIKNLIGRVLNANEAFLPTDKATLGEGLKVNAFARAIKGDTSAVVVDRWMWRIFYPEESAAARAAFEAGTRSSPDYAGTPARYHLVEAWVQQNSQQLGIAPANFQAAMWVGAKIEKGDTAGIEPLKQMIRKRIKEHGNPLVPQVVRDAYRDAVAKYGGPAGDVNGFCVECATSMAEYLTARGVKASVRRYETPKYGGHWTVTTEFGEFDPTIGFWQRPRPSGVEYGAGMHQVTETSPHANWTVDPGVGENIPFGGMSEDGQVNAATLGLLVRVGLGAAVGAATGETPEQKIIRGFAGAGFAAVAPSLVRRMAKFIEPFTVQAPGARATEYAAMAAKRLGAGKSPGSLQAAYDTAAGKITDTAAGTVTTNGGATISKGFAVDLGLNVGDRMGTVARPFEYGSLDPSADRVVQSIVNKSPLEARAAIDEIAGKLNLSALPADPAVAAEVLHREMKTAFGPSWDAARGSTTITDINQVANALGLDEVMSVMQGGTESASALSSPEFVSLTTAYKALLAKSAKILDDEIEGLGTFGRLTQARVDEAYQAVRIAGELWARRQAGLSEGARVMRMAQEDPGARASTAFMEGLQSRLARNELNDASPSLRLEVIRAAAASEPGTEQAAGFLSILGTRLADGLSLTHAVVQDAWKSAQLTGFRGAMSNFVSSLSLAVERPMALGLAAGWGLAKRAAGTVDPEKLALAEAAGGKPAFVYASEVPAYAFGFIAGLPDAILSAGNVVVGNPSRFLHTTGKVAESRHLAWEAWKSVENPLAKVAFAPAMVVSETVGTLLRTVARAFIQSPDEFVRTVADSGIVYQRAMHDAINASKLSESGLSFKEITAKVQDGIKHVSPGTDQIARAQADVYAYQSSLIGAYGSPLASFARWGQSPTLGWVFPFARAMANSALTKIEHLPGGHLISPRAQTIINMGGEAERQVYIGQSILGLTFLGAGVYLAETGKFAHWLKEGYAKITGQPAPDWAETAVRIEGSGPMHPGSRQAWKEAGGKPDTLWGPGDAEGMTLDRLGHVGTFLGLAAEVADASGQAHSHDIIQQFLENIAIPLGKLAMDPNWAGPIRNFFDAAQQMGGSGTDKLKLLLQEYSGSIVPTGVRTVERYVDPALRGKWDETMSFMQNMWQATKSQIPGLSATVPPRLDQWASPMLSPEGWAPFDVPEGIDWLTMAVPAYGVKKITDPATVEIITHQMGIALPPKGLYGPAPDRYGVEDPNPPIQLTNTQYNRYVELQGASDGRELKLPVGRAVNGLFGTSLPDTAGRHEVLNAIAGSARYAAMTDGRNGMKAEIFRTVTREFRQASEFALLTDPIATGLAKQYMDYHRGKLLAKFGPDAVAGLPDTQVLADQMTRAIRQFLEATQ